MCVVELYVEVETELTTENGDSIKLYRTAAQLTQPVTPAKHPPTGLKLIREVEIDYNCYTVCHHKRYTYACKCIYGSTVYRLDHQGKVEKVYTGTSNVADLESLAAHEDRLFFLESAKKSTKLFVLGLNDGKLLTSWTVSHYEYCGRQMSTINDDQLAVGDWRREQIIIYSLTGDVIRRVPLPHCLTMEDSVCMSSCGDDSVVISAENAGKVVRISLKDGSVIWRSDSITEPYGVVHHPAGYILVSSGYNDQVVIDVLDEINGMLYDL